MGPPHISREATAGRSPCIPRAHVQTTAPTVVVFIKPQNSDILVAGVPEGIWMGQGTGLVPANPTSPPLSWPLGPLSPRLLSGRWVRGHSGCLLEQQRPLCKRPHSGPAGHQAGQRGVLGKKTPKDRNHTKGCHGYVQRTGLPQHSRVTRKGVLWSKTGVDKGGWGLQGSENNAHALECLGRGS